MPEKKAKREKDALDKTKEILNDDIDNIDETTKKLDVVSDEAIDSEKEDITDKSSVDEKPEESTKIIDDTEIVYNEDNELAEDFIFDKRKKNKQYKKTKIIIMTLVFLVIITALIFVGLYVRNYIIKNNDGDIEKEEKLSSSEKKEIIDAFGENLEKVIKERLLKDGYLMTFDEAYELIDVEYSISCEVTDIYNDGSIYLNKCSIDKEKIDYVYGKVQSVEEIDEKTILKVYVDNSSGEVLFKKPIGDTGYTTYVVHCGEIYNNPMLLDNGSDYVLYTDTNNALKMVNYKKDEKALPSVTYQEIVPIKIGDDKYDDTNVAVKISNFWGVYNIKTGSQIISPTYANFMMPKNGRKEIEIIDNQLIVASDGKKYGVINYLTNKVVISFDYAGFSRINNHIVAINDKEEKHIYDNAGQRKLGMFNSIDALYEDVYFIVSDQESKKLVQIDGTILYDYGIINNMGGFYDTNVNEKIVSFRFYEGESKTKCIEFTYDSLNKIGSHSSTKCD